MDKVSFLKKPFFYLRLVVHNSFFNMSLTAARMAALRLGYIPDLVSSSSPVKYASGRRTVTSFIHVSPDTLHVNELICNYSLNRVYLGKFRINTSFLAVYFSFLNNKSC